jgi:predicted membrane-bound spermidine synthase
MGNGNQIANATLTVLPAVVAVPTLSEWAMILFALMLLSYGLHRQRGRSSRALSPEEH